MSKIGVKNDQKSTFINVKMGEVKIDEKLSKFGVKK
jgi:hypothetical protein